MNILFELKEKSCMNNDQINFHININLYLYIIVITTGLDGSNSHVIEGL